MKKIIVLLFLIFILYGCKEEDSKEVIPFTYEELMNKDYKTVVAKLKEKGFTNIETNAIYDLVSKENQDSVGKVKDFKIEGIEWFDEKKVQLDSIIITYHEYTKCNFSISNDEIKGLSYDEVNEVLKNSDFFNIQYELILDEDKDNIVDHEVEYISVNGNANYNFDEEHPVNSNIVVYHSYIEESMPELSSSFKGKSLDEVENILNKTKFEVESKVIDDIDGDNVLPKEVEYIEIDGKSDYELEEKYPINKKVTIYYSYLADKMPISSTKAYGKSMEEVLKLFENTKFTNVKTKTNVNSTIDESELIVDHISLNNSDAYSLDTMYPYNSEICIYYSQKEYNVELCLDCEENLIFNKYNLQVYINNDYLGLLEHGKSEVFKTKLTKGKYDLIIQSNDDNSIKVGKSINIKADRVLRYDVSCHSSKINLVYYKPLKVPFTNKNVVEKDVNKVISAFEEAGYKKIKRIALNDLSKSELKKSNTVDRIKINDSEEFSKDSTFYEFDEVEIYYHSGMEIEVPIYSSDAKYVNYKEIVSEFKEAGFVNVSIEKYSGKYKDKARHNEVAMVTIDGDDYFTKGSNCSLDAKIVVYCYKINYEKVTVRKLMNDLDKNAYNARTYYDDKYVSVTGYISDIDSYGTSLEMVSSNDGWDFWGVTCDISDKAQREIIANLSTGMKVTVKGKIKLVSDYGYYMDIHDIIVK